MSAKNTVTKTFSLPRGRTTTVGFPFYDKGSENGDESISAIIDGFSIPMRAVKGLQQWINNWGNEYDIPNPTVAAFILLHAFGLGGQTDNESQCRDTETLKFQEALGIEPNDPALYSSWCEKQTETVTAEELTDKLRTAYADEYNAMEARHVLQDTQKGCKSAVNALRILLDDLLGVPNDVRAAATK